MSGSEAVTEKPSHSLGRLRDAVARRLTIGRSVLRGGANYMTNLVWLLMRSVDERRCCAVRKLTRNVPYPQTR